MKSNFLHLLCILSVLLAASCKPDCEHIKNELRAPAYPLVTIDPYTCSWSTADNLYDTPVTHWTGAQHHLLGVLTVDGVNYRFLGEEVTEKEYIVKPSGKVGWDCRYTLTKPGKKWMEPGFDDSSWTAGRGAFGSKNKLPNVQTLWDGLEIWTRRTFTLEKDIETENATLYFMANQFGAIYINGILVHDDDTYLKNPYLKLSKEVIQSLKAGENTIAAYCKNPTGSAHLDFSIAVDVHPKGLYSQTATQLYADVQPMNTHYAFNCGPVELKLSFLAPLFLDNLELISRPVNYISYKVESLDGKEHDVQLLLEATPAWAVNFYRNEETESATYEKDGLLYLKASSVEQDILGKQGDDDRINWGSFYLVAENENTVASVLDNGYLQFVRTLGQTDSSEGKFMIGYDDLYSVQYFGENLRPYWNRTGDVSIESQFESANEQYEDLSEDAEEFDCQLMKEATEAGGRKYAELCALAYRQAIAAHKLVETNDGFITFLSKENFSNGSIGTVDVTYPSLPLFLKYNPELAKALMNHIFHYSESGRWTKPFPAHDVGTYPLANGQTYGYDMPVEEAGNMLIGTAAVCAYEGCAAYAEKHWDVMTGWVDYLCEYGLDPDNQLCTDDFAGHSAHNTNLSIKAILGIASYARMAEMSGLTETAEKYHDIAVDLAAKWKEMAFDGDHYRLAFDSPGTWSQKYNLVWDNLLGLNVFDDDIAETEIAFYLNKQNIYGLPLDYRATYSKSDWIVWTATMAENKETFEAFIEPLWKFYDETELRVPMSDWFYTDKPRHRSFVARSVVGGYFIKLLPEVE